MIRFAFIALLTFAVLGAVFFLSSSHAQLESAADTPSKIDDLFR